MPDYRAMYLKMVHATDDAVELNKKATARLIQARRDAEDLLIEANDTPIPFEAPIPENSDPK